MAHYLPVLLVSVSTNAVPDDSSLVTLPRGQVDYLSHEWAEEDVWRSWRNMTRQKNEIANGMRLENASWRTWWKQRNKLKTVTPETLNWLKDSDVTWLYGPLHTAVDWAPPPKPKSDPTEVGKLSSAEDRLDLAAKHKPILKHRSITEILQSDLPVSPVFTPVESEDDEAEQEIVTRPPLTQTKSAPLIPRPSHPFLRRPSPPRVLRVPAPPTPPTSAGAPAKRHITFNTFVEQCIAVDTPRRIPLSHNSSNSSSNSNNSSDASDPSGPRAAWDGRTRGLRWTGDEDDSDDEENWGVGESALSSDSDDALEVCLPRSRSNSSHSRRSSHNSNKSLFTLSTNSKTIAPIAPTRLKTTGVGNGWHGGEWVGTRDEGRDPEDVSLPRSGAAVDLVAASRNLSSAFEDEDSFEEDVNEDEVFTHRSAYFSATGAYDYFAGPDLGVEFGPAIAREREHQREPRGRRGSNASAEIMEIEGALLPSALRSRSRSKSKSKSRTPSPADLPPSSSSPSTSPPTGVSPNASSPTIGGLLSPPPRGRDSSLSSSSSASQGRGRSATRTSSSSSLSDRERSRSSHTSPLGSLSPEYGGVRVSADYGAGFPYTGAKGMRRGVSGSVSPDGTGSVSPEKGSVVSSGTTASTDSANSAGSRSSGSAEDSNSSGATATRPRVEVNGGRLDDVEEEEARGRGLVAPTPANSPVVRIREPMFVSPADKDSPNMRTSPGSARSSSGSGSSSGTPTRGSTSNRSSAANTSPSPSNNASPSPKKSAPSPKKSTSPTSKSIPISPPRGGGGGARSAKSQPLVIGVGGDEEFDEAAASPDTQRSAPTPANSPVVRMRVPQRIPDAPAPPGAGVNGRPVQSTAKSIPKATPPPAREVPKAAPSPARATFQTGVSGPSSGSTSSSASASALQRTLVPSPPLEAGPGEAPSMVGKAVGMVSTAGAYLGLWSGAGA
ncbi:hypothetical protein C8R47DRAFT_1313392 [Mycena vitilis]|nr:hypothetical protein C8R47DRAFT_1313392 [Mycena vitilis]